MSASVDAPHRRAFLRWVENGAGEDDPGGDDPGEDGTGSAVGATEPRHGREWGQLLIRVERDASGSESDGTPGTAADGGEFAGCSYELRHVDDAGVPAGELDRHDDPLAARRLSKFDDDGRYRPLSTAPTLQTGWLFPDLGPAALVRAVESFYPATVANWYREREGELDVSHWHETVSRQTGIYGLVETWDRGEGHDHVEWVAEACCADSECLKRREWEYDGDTELAVDGGEGAFPCREPCSLVIAAARRWTRMEAEAERSYEFELTPSEKEQLEALIDAVADGRVGEIREADTAEGANRYRARFLRAKRFEDGDFCGVPTEPEED